MGAARNRLDAGRWHFQHGPIDIVVGADGDAFALVAAHAAAWLRFETLLAELVAELPLLRQPVGEACPLQGVIARRMWQACAPYRARFITPMAAVAGAVAQELIACYVRPGIERAWVNNGGDIALHLAPGHALRIGVFGDLSRFDPFAAPARLAIDASFSVGAELPVRGVATSGWQGRSFSLGIADSVTVLARTAADADAAATVIANAVDIIDERIERRPACEMKDDSDLGELLVTVDVPPLEPAAIQRALAAGHERARELLMLGHIQTAMLLCQGWFVSVDDATPRKLTPAVAGTLAVPALA
jgi:ApbE superfamily uncharacterized protein (UPF0280 family)